MPMYKPMASKGEKLDEGGKKERRKTRYTGN